MSAFSASTQARYWLFTPETLAAAQEQRHQASVAPSEPAAAAASLKRARPADDEAAGGGGGGGDGGGGKRARAEDGGAASAPAAAAAAGRLTLAEEQHLLAWCGLALQRMCRGAQLDRAVTATAHAYLRRFYVRGLFAHYPPHEML